MAEADPSPAEQPNSPQQKNAPAAEPPFDAAIASFDSAEDVAASAGAQIDDAALQELLKLADQGAEAVAGLGDPLPGSPAEPSPGGALPPDAANFDLPNFQQVIADAAASSIDLLRDVELNVKIELGRSRMLVEDVLKLSEGSVVELDKLAGDPVDVFVNERLVARGEVLVLNDNFCVRVNEIVATNKDDDAA